MTITILADENITALRQYLTGHNVNLICTTGRNLPNLLPNYQADAVFVRSTTPINADTIGRLAYKPQFVATATLGTDHIDTSFLQKNNIGFADAKGTSKHSVAQYVLTAIFSLRPKSLTAPIRLGIIGLGNIGSTLAHYAVSLGWQVIAYDPLLPSSPPTAYLTHTHDLADVLTSDVVSIHTPLTTGGLYPTYQMVDDDFLATMPNDTLLINTARGQIVDDVALMADIDRTNRQVVLDVFASEPTLSATLLERLSLATPHIAGYSLDGKLRGTDSIYQAFCRYFELPILHHLNEFLPPSDINSEQLFKTLKHNPDAIKSVYDIKKDDKLLRQCLHNGQVAGADFDALRKNYPLRREWY